MPKRVSKPGISFSTVGVKRVEKNMANRSAEMRQRMAKLTTMVAAEIVTRAKKTLAARAGSKTQAGTDTGRLAASIRWKKVNAIGRHILTDVHYWRHVEYGTTHTKMPPPDALKDWCRRNLGDERLAFVVARSILQRGGLDASPFLRPAVDAVKKKHLQRVRALTKEVAGG